MNTYEFITIGIAIVSIIVSAILTGYSIRSSNKSTKQMSILMRENSRMTSSEHLSLYRIEAFYNAVAIRNLEFDIQETQARLNTEEKDKQALESKLKKLQMNLRFMKIREARLMQTDFTLQHEINELHNEFQLK